MKSSFILIATALLLLSSLILAESNVIELDSNNFDEKVKSTQYTLVEFYAPWCGHCKKLAPEYEKLADELKDDQTISIAKLNGDQESSLMEKFGVQGFPTLKLFKDGELYRDYEGERTAEALKKWIEKKAGPVSKPLNTEDEVNEFKQSAKAVVIGFFNEKGSEYDAFISAVDQKDLEDFPVGEVIGNKELNDKYGAKENSVVVFRSFNKEPAHTQDTSNLVEFIKENGYPLVDEVSAETFQRLLERGLPIGILFINFDDEDKKQQYVDMLTEIAPEYKDHVTLGYSNAELYGEQLKIMGGDKDNLPGFGILDLENQSNYIFEDQPNVDKEKLSKFISDFTKGELQPYLKSEEVPETNDEPVKVVVGKTFEEMVKNSDNDVLLEFYAPWCGHCKSLEPKYKELAEEMADVKGLTIAKIDATENDTPIKIEGFPTIYFFASGKKDEPIAYDGDRSVSDMKQFIVKNAVASKDSLSETKKDEL